MLQKRQRKKIELETLITQQWKLEPNRDLALKLAQWASHFGAF
jgi:hypothetical protein